MITLLWTVTSFSFYCCNLLIKYIPGDFENNAIVMSGTDILSPTLAGVLIGNFSFSAKRLFILFSLTTALCTTAMIVTVDDEDANWTAPALIGLARSGMAASFTTLYLTHLSFFPTLFAVTSMGIANFVARSFVAIAPIVAEADYPKPVIVISIL